MKEKIVVLLSSYNGEKYIGEQLSSIANQANVDVYCIIRDDGSKDGTIEILKDFCKSHHNFIYIENKNIGAINSFNALMGDKAVDGYKWVAFCDQDDIWLEDKLCSGIRYLKEHSIESDKSPLLYCSNLLVFNTDNGETYLRRSYIPKANKYTVLVQNYGTGCTMIFNQAARKLYNRGIGKNMEWHDYWMMLVCTYLGTVLYDNNYYIRYRLHGDNQVGAYTKTISGAIKNITQKKYGYRVRMLDDFLNTYNDLLDKEDKQIILKLIKYKDNLINRIMLACDHHYRGYEIKVTLNFKLRSLLGRIY